MISSGTLLGDRYRLQRRIAAGGMATVWLGRDEELQREVAVKVLSEALLEDPSYLLRFRREARLAAGLTHPSLVRIYDYSGEAERPYLVMEHVNGGTLADRIAGERAHELDPRSLARQLLGALRCIHLAGVVHRDVKPSNVLIDGEGRARLTDFGIAHPEGGTRITQTGEVIGTLKYMAPEVREGRAATERSDLYACGVLLGECLAGDSASEVVVLVDRLSQSDPAKRPGSARDALTLLDEAKPARTETAPFDAAPRTRPWREVEISGLHVIAVLAALALVGVLAAVAIGGSSGGSSDRPRGSARATTTVSSTTTSVTTTTSIPPAATSPAASAHPPKAEPKPPKDQKVPPGLAKKESGAQKGGTD